MNVKDRSYNRQCREMDRSPPDWRMRPTSVDGRDNITRPERGPLGSGGVAATEVPHAVAVSKSAAVTPKDGVNVESVGAWQGWP